MFEERKSVHQASYCAAVVCVQFLRHLRILDKPHQGEGGYSKHSHSNGVPSSCALGHWSVLPATYISDWAERAFWTTKLKAVQFLLKLSTAKMRLGSWRRFWCLLWEQFYFQDFSYCEHRVWIACSIKHFRCGQSCVLPPKKRRLFSIRLIMHLSMLRRTTSRTQRGRTLGCLFKEISLHALSFYNSRVFFGYFFSCQTNINFGYRLRYVRWSFFETSENSSPIVCV